MFSFTLLFIFYWILYRRVLGELIKNFLYEIMIGAVLVYPPME